MIEQDIPALTDGYLHCDACPARSRRVSNTGLEPISYDNFMVTYLRGTVAALNITTMGAAYVQDRKYGDIGAGGPVYRKGTFLTRTIWKGQGDTLGRNLVINKLKDGGYEDLIIGWRIDVHNFNAEIEAHETYHRIQPCQMGFGNFYGQTLIEYITLGRLNSYCTPGSLEWNADMNGIQKLDNTIYR